MRKATTDDTEVKCTQNENDRFVWEVSSSSPLARQKVFFYFLPFCIVAEYFQVFSLTRSRDRCKSGDSARKIRDGRKKERKVGKICPNFCHGNAIKCVARIPDLGTRNPWIRSDRDSSWRVCPLVSSPFFQMWIVYRSYSHLCGVSANKLPSVYFYTFISLLYI